MHSHTVKFGKPEINLPDVRNTNANLKSVKIQAVQSVPSILAIDQGLKSRVQTNLGHHMMSNDS